MFLFTGLLSSSLFQQREPLFSPFPHQPAFPHPSSHQINDIHLILISSDTLPTEHLNTAHFSDISPTYSFPSTHPYPCISIISFPFSVSLSPHSLHSLFILLVPHHQSFFLLFFLLFTPPRFTTPPLQQAPSFCGRFLAHIPFPPSILSYLIHCDPFLNHIYKSDTHQCHNLFPLIVSVSINNHKYSI